MFISLADIVNIAPFLYPETINYHSNPMPSIPKPGYFKKDQLDTGSQSFFQKNGFLVVPEALSAAELESLRNETVAICRGQRGQVISGNTENPASPEDLENLSDIEILTRILCIHQPHKISPTIHSFLAHRVIADVLTKVVSPNIKCMQSMLFIKASGKPGQAWHQDEDYIPTRDRSLTGAWIALDDATVENGCLWVIPGSHQPGILWPQYPHNDPRFDCSYESYDFPYNDNDAVAVEVPAGSIVFFNGYLLHRSLPNVKKTGFRRALVNHYMSAESLLPWRVQDKIGIAKTDYRDIVMIAGNDPYAYKGIENIAHPYIRPAGEGGCGDGRTDLETFRTRPVLERATT